MIFLSFSSDIIFPMNFEIIIYAISMKSKFLKDSRVSSVSFGILSNMYNPLSKA
ncbi:hypothetical protein LCGC14_1401290 [marine sediment metagenome]|uniref:Uncharacterized protein n=1 Tax=marine sediment metagenome TaxID=412755 RepID=A0A0F9MCL3_9ZZZZ